MSDPIDLEVYAAEGKAVPKGESYRIRIDKTHYVWEHDEISGRQLLELATKDSARFGVYQRVHGKNHRVQLDEKVDLTKPGVERFQTLPLDQTEG